MNIKKFVLPILVLLIVVVGGFAFSFYQKASVLKGAPATAAQIEATETIAKVAKLIMLPEGEVPSVATITDPSKLKDQQFFAKAKVGDKVLLYNVAKKAYLYDVQNNKILEVAPIGDGVGQTTPTPKGTTPEKTTTKK